MCGKKFNVSLYDHLILALLGTTCHLMVVQADITCSTSWHQLVVRVDMGTSRHGYELNSIPQMLLFVILWNSMTSTSFVFTELANTMKYGEGFLYNLVFTEWRPCVSQNEVWGRGVILTLNTSLFHPSCSSGKIDLCSGLVLYNFLFTEWRHCVSHNCSLLYYWYSHASADCPDVNINWTCDMYMVNYWSIMQRIIIYNRLELHDVLFASAVLVMYRHNCQI